MKNPTNTRIRIIINFCNFVIIQINFTFNNVELENWFFLINSNLTLINIKSQIILLPNHYLTSHSFSIIRIIYIIIHSITNL